MRWVRCWGLDQMTQSHPWPAQPTSLAYEYLPTTNTHIHIAMNILHHTNIGHNSSVLKYGTWLHACVSYDILLAVSVGEITLNSNSRVNRSLLYAAGRPTLVSIKNNTLRHKNALLTYPCPQNQFLQPVPFATWLSRLDMKLHK